MSYVSYFFFSTTQVNKAELVKVALVTTKSK